MSQRNILIFDVRLPLDLLGESEIITGAKWIDPAEIIKNPALIPKDEDSVIYCTCPSDATGIKVLRRALALHFSRMRLLRGGLDAWKADGYEVVPYKGMIRLDTAKWPA
jgi:rhodanese-related sulfurtransferase